MQFRTYIKEVLDTQPRAAKARNKFCKRIGMSPSLLWQIAEGKRPIPERYCPVIERETNRKVSCEEMRPEIDWAYLRGTQRRKKEGVAA